MEADSETSGYVLPSCGGQGVPALKGLSEDLGFPGGKFRTQEDQRLGLKPSVAPVCNPREAGGPRVQGQDELPT